MIPTEKICLFCKWFYFTAGTKGWSEYTPGSEMDIGCEKDHWDVCVEEDREYMLREKMLRARKCKDYELSSDVLDIQ